MAAKNTKTNKGKDGWYQGFYRPKNPKKYKGDPTKIIYRSSWERRMMVYCDTMPHVIQWNSEEVIIPYADPHFDPMSNKPKIRRYYMDFWLKYYTKDKTVVEALVEVKPKKQVNRPKQPKRVTRNFLNECKTWATNQAKWAAAREYCKKRNMQFLIFTEDQLA